MLHGILRTLYGSYISRKHSAERDGWTTVRRESECNVKVHPKARDLINMAMPLSLNTSQNLSLIMSLVISILMLPSSPPTTNREEANSYPSPVSTRSPVLSIPFQLPTRIQSKENETVLFSGEIPFEDKLAKGVRVLSSFHLKLRHNGWNEWMKIKINSLNSRALESFAAIQRLTSRPHPCPASGPSPSLSHINNSLAFIKSFIRFVHSFIHSFNSFIPSFRASHIQAFSFNSNQFLHF